MYYIVTIFVEIDHKSSNVFKCNALKKKLLKSQANMNTKAMLIEFTLSFLIF